MDNRSGDIQDLIDCLAAAVEFAGQSDGAEISSLFNRLRTCGEQIPEGSGKALPVLDLLPSAMATAQGGSDPVAALARSLAAIAPRLGWFTRPAENLPDFSNGHANAHIIGPRGLEARDDVYVGVTLMAPAVQYPEHRHPPEEVYVAMSEGEWRQDKGPWHAPGYGGLVYNPSNTRHAMRAGSRPLLAMWCLWPK